VSAVVSHRDYGRAGGYGVFHPFWLGATTAPDLIWVAGIAVDASCNLLPLGPLRGFRRSKSKKFFDGKALFGSFISHELPDPFPVRIHELLPPLGDCQGQGVEFPDAEVSNLHLLVFLEGGITS
jgi:hypothetical protein